MVSDEAFIGLILFSFLTYMIFFIWIPPLVTSWLVCKFANIEDGASKKRLRTGIFLYFYALHLLLPVLIVLDLTTDTTNKSNNEWVIYPLAIVFALLGLIALIKLLIARYGTSTDSRGRKTSKAGERRIKQSTRPPSRSSQKVFSKRNLTELFDDILVILPALVAALIIILSVIF